jgi:hypothetical protein
MKSPILFSVLYLFFIQSWAQNQTILPILQISPSTRLNGMAGVGVALPSTDPFAQYANPAQVGYSSQFTNFSIHFYPGALKISSRPKPEVRNSGANLGYRLPAPDKTRPVSFGVGYLNSDLDLGEVLYLDDSGVIIQRTINNETFYSISAGFGFGYFVDINFGFAYKWITSDLGFLPTSDSVYVRARDNPGALDYGILLVAPLHRLIVKPAKDFRPQINFSLGYSRTNNGGEVRYNNLLPAQPMPRTARLGYGLTLGLGINIRNKPIKAFEAYWSVEANDLLVEQNEGGFSYQGFFGDIDIFKHIIKGQGDELVTSRVGYGVELFETVYLASGYYEGMGFDKTVTFGYGFRTRGIFRFFQERYTKNAFSFIVDNVDLQYYTSKYAVYPGDEIRYHGFVLSISGF